MEANQSEGSVQLRIVRGPVDSLSLFEITDYELEVLEEGAPSSTFLNFAILFASVGLSFLTTLLTVTIASIQVFTIFVVLTVGGLGGILCSLCIVAQNALPHQGPVQEDPRACPIGNFVPSLSGVHTFN